MKNDVRGHHRFTGRKVRSRHSEEETSAIKKSLQQAKQVPDKNEGDIKAISTISADSSGSFFATKCVVEPDLGDEEDSHFGARIAIVPSISNSP